MDVFLMIVTAVITGVAVTVATRREGIGWWMGDLISALFGAGTGLYMVSTINNGKAIDYYLFWVVAVSAAGALASLSFSNLLLGGEEEDTETLSGAVGAYGADFQQVEEEYDQPLRRAA